MNLPIPQEIEVSIQSQELDNLRILHLSDLHISKKTRDSSLTELVTICNSIAYDFIVITGDIIDEKVKHIKGKLQILNSLKSKAYYISGNHDLVYDIQELKEELDNFVFMDNECKSFDFNNHKIYIAGLPDRFSHFFKIKRDITKISKFLQINSATILLAHQPKDYQIALSTNTSLFLCGHTHGGQIFPFHYLVRLAQPFLKGLHYRGNTAIYINSGVGTWGIHHRFKAPSEITLLKLRYNNK